MWTSPNSNTKPKDQTSPSLGIFFPAFAVIRWIFYLTKEWGYAPYRGWGIALSLGMYIGSLAGVFSIDYLLARAGIRRTIRSGVWASAFIGPYLGLAAFNAWGHPVWSQVAGVAGTVTAFVITYLVDRLRHGA